MSVRNGLIMLVVLIIASAYLVYDGVLLSGGSGKEEDGAIASPIETGLKIDEINQVEIKTEQTDFNLERVPDPRQANQLLWRIRETPNFTLDPDTLVRILDQLGHLQSLNFIAAQEADSDPANYGLKNPSLLVRISSGGGRSGLVLRFGERHKLSGRRYLEIENRPGVYVVDEAVFKTLALTPFDIRERRPLRLISLANLDGITLRRKSGALVFGHPPDSEHQEFWVVSEESDSGIEGLAPQSMEADTLTLETLITSLVKLSASDFFDSPPKDLSAYGLSQPILTLILKLKRPPSAVGALEPESILVKVGEVRGEGLQENGVLPKREYYFQINGELPIYRVEKRFFSDFLQGIHFFRNRQPLRELDPEKITKFSLGRKAQSPILLEREGKRSWTAKQGEKMLEVDSREVSEFLSALKGLTVLTYVEENTTLGPASNNEGGPELFVSFEQGTEVGALTIYGAVGEFSNAGNVSSSGPNAGSALDDAPRLASIRIGANPAIRFILGSDLFKALNVRQQQAVNEKE